MFPRRALLLLLPLALAACGDQKDQAKLEAALDSMNLQDSGKVGGKTAADSAADTATKSVPGLAAPTSGTPTADTTKQRPPQ